MIDGNEKIIKHKVGLLNLTEELGNVPKACHVIGFTRDTFYRYKSAADEGGVEGLFEKSRRQPNLKNRIDPRIEDVVVLYAVDESAHGQVRISNEPRKRGTFVYFTVAEAATSSWITSAHYSDSPIMVIPIATDTQNPTLQADWIGILMPGDKRIFHVVSAAKNTVSFFKMSFPISKRFAWDLSFLTLFLFRV